jgi:hypothetical protein
LPATPASGGIPALGYVAWATNGRGIGRREGAGTVSKPAANVQVKSTHAGSGGDARNAAISTQFGQPAQPAAGSRFRAKTIRLSLKRASV